MTTGAIPHYDTSIEPESGLEDPRYAAWDAENGTLDGSDGNSDKLGNYKKQLNSAGANDWIGLQKRWEVLWLYSMSDRGWEMVTGNADLAGRMPIFFREADSLAGSGDYFDQTYTEKTNLASAGTSKGTGTVDTFGRIISVNARRTTSLQSTSDNNASSADRINKGSVTKDGWTQQDSSHFSDACYTAYLFSGRYYYMECLQMEAAYLIAWKLAGWNSTYARPGNVGLINNTNIRTDAWGLKAIAYAAFASPDGQPERAYLLDKLNDNLAEFEGIQNLPLTHSGKQEVWNYGRNVRAKNSVILGGLSPSPLGQWYVGGSAFIQSPLQSKSSGILNKASSPWEENFVLCALGMMHQMEVADTSGLLKFMAKKRFRLNLGTIADQNTILNNFTEAYRDPTVEASTNNWVTTMDAFVSHYNTSLEPYTERRSGLTTDHSYAFIALAADSFLTSYMVDGFNGQEAYNTNKQLTPFQDRFETSSPKWAITPLTGGSSSVPPVDNVPPAPPSNLTLTTN